LKSSTIWKSSNALKCSKTHASSSSLVRKLAFYWSEHCAIYFFVQYTNSRFISTFMTVTFGTNILLNALMIRLLVYKHLLLGERILLCGIIILESLLSMAASNEFVILSDALHKPKDLLYRCQMALQSGENYRFGTV